MSKPILTFKVFVDPENCSDMTCPYGGVSFIPFTATVESEMFTGMPLPGACDVQVKNPAGSRTMCAKYMFEGVDGEGNSRHVFVENNGYRRGHAERPCFSRLPRFYY